MARRYHFVNGQPERVAHHHLQGRVPRPHAGDHRRRRQREVPGRLRRAGAEGFDHRAVRRSRRRRGGDRARDGRHHDRAGAGRGRRARRLRRVPAGRCAQLCDKHGLLLVLDEVQCGMGRTGKLFAHEWAGITPDVMAIAKGIGGGFPVGAFLATEEAAKGMVPGTHGSTFGGNPLAMAVGNAVLDAVLEPGFLDAACRQGRCASSRRWRALKDEYPARDRGGARQRPAGRHQGEAAGRRRGQGLLRREAADRVGAGDNVRAPAAAAQRHRRRDRARPIAAPVARARAPAQAAPEPVCRRQTRLRRAPCRPGIFSTSTASMPARCGASSTWRTP